MAGIYWLASYPKSGNTWIRVLLTNYWQDSEEPANINNLEGGHIASARGVFDDWIGLDSADMTPSEVEAYRPLLYRYMAKKADTNLFMKVHDAYEYTIHNEPIFPANVTKGIVYIIRNPLDVAVSFAFYNQATVAQSVRSMSSNTAALAPTTRSLKQQFQQNLRSWSEHVCSWVDAPNVRVQVVRYEDLIMQPVKAFSQVLRFCELPDSPKRVKKSVDFSRFERLKTQEKENGFDEKSFRAASFFRKGKVGDWREHLTEKQVFKIVNDHRDVMRRFGYLTKTDEIIF